MCNDLLSVIAVYRLDGLEGQSVYTIRCELNHIHFSDVCFRHHGESAYPQCPPFTGHRGGERVRRALRELFIQSPVPGDGGGLH